MPNGVGLHGKPICTAPGCNKIYRGEQEVREGLKFHMFPTKDDLVKEWLYRLGLEGFQPRTCNRVCGLHFEADAYRPTKTGKLLKVDALPIPVDETLKPSMLCLVPGCSARSDRPGRYALFPFPLSDAELCRRWEAFCHLEEEKKGEEPLPRTAAVCANHFLPAEIINVGGSVRLKSGAVPAHFGPTIFATVRSSPSALAAPRPAPGPAQTAGASGAHSVTHQKQSIPESPAESLSKWKSGGCRFQCALCGSMIPNTLELASHQRAAHGLDLETYVRANGHSRVHTAHIDCALCAESVMHDLGAFRRHLVVVHAGVSMDEYYRKFVARNEAQGGGGGGGRGCEQDFYEDGAKEGGDQKRKQPFSSPSVGPIKKAPKVVQGSLSINDLIQ